MTAPNEPSKSTINAQAAIVAGRNCREFFDLTDITHGVPPLRSPIPLAKGTAQARQLITTLFPLTARVCVAVSCNSTKTMEAGKFSLLIEEAPDGALFKTNHVVSNVPSGLKGGWTDKDCATELVMIEMDRAPKPEQLLFWRAALALGFPVVSLTDSGSKSIHAIIRVRAGSHRTYREKAHAVIRLLGVFIPDATSANCSRFTRLPGIHRGEGDAKRFQELLYLNPDAPVWNPLDGPQFGMGHDFFRAVSEFSKTAMPVPEKILSQEKARQSHNLDPLTREQEDREFRKRLDALRIKNGIALDDAISELGWEVGESFTTPAGEFKQYVQCPWHAEHSGGGASDGPTDAYIFRRGTAARFPWGFHCSHSSCCGVYKAIDLLERIREDHAPVVENHILPFVTPEELFPDDGGDGADTTPRMSLSPDGDEETALSECASVQSFDDLSTVRTDHGDEEAVEVPMDMSTVSNDSDYTDIFVRKFKSRVRYLHDERTWLIWNGKRWKRDVTEYINLLADDVRKHLMKKAANTPEMRSAKQAGNLKAIEQMLKKARGYKELYAKSAEFDTDKWLLGCKNGVLNLRTGEFRPARPLDKITRSVSVQFDPLAACPRWEKFIEELHPGDPLIQHFLRRFFGYALTGSVQEQKMLIFLGHGCNGKSTLTKHIQKVLGEYALTCPKSLLLSSKNGDGEGASPEVISLKGIRMGTVAETDPGVALSDSRIKLMVGGEEVTGRKLYGQYETFEPEAKLILSTNHTPRVKGNDKGIWRRIMLVDFKEDFDDRRDPLLDHIIETEYAGILNWMIRGCMEWQEKGLMPPSSITSSTEEYRYGEDYLKQFIEERIDFKDGVGTPKSDIYQAFSRWAGINGYNAMPSVTFGKAMTERGGLSGRSSVGRFWTNLVLKDEIMSE